LIDVAPKNLDAELASVYFLSLLDADVLGSGAGVSKANFEAIFCVCGKCFAHMTRRIAVSHKCGHGGDEEWPYYYHLPITSP
jgi:hypothetical protein